MYNLTNLTSSNYVSDLVIFANEVTDGVFIGFTTVGIFFILLLIMKKASFIDSLIVSSFTCFMLSLILTFAGLLNFGVIIVFFLLMAIGAWYKKATNS